MRNRRLAARLLAVVFLAGSLSSCAALGFPVFRQVDFRIDQVTGVQLAGVPVDRFRTYQDIGATDIQRLLSAVARRTAPMAMTVHIDAHNPADNAITAHLVRLDWRLMLEDRETVRGVYERSVQLPAGENVGFPLDIELDLVPFFGENARQLAEIALRAAGHGTGNPVNLRLLAQPTIDTPLGPIRYPGEIIITTTL
jgi:hypothetical protein